MGNLEKHLYVPLMEETDNDVSGWQKDTVEFVTKNPRRVESLIRRTASGFKKTRLQQADVDDIYQDILLYLHSSSDYDINKAIYRSSTGTIVSLEGYLNVCIKYCVMRSLNLLAEHDNETVSESILDGDDKELSIFNTIPDENANIDYDYLSYDLQSICKCCEPLRYRLGIDIYLVFYVRLLINEYGAKSNYKDILNILDITRADLKRFDNLSDDSLVTVMAKMVSITPIEEALETLEGYVYSASLIKQAISTLS